LLAIAAVLEFGFAGAFASFRTVFPGVRWPSISASSAAEKLSAPSSGVESRRVWAGGLETEAAGI